MRLQVLYDFTRFLRRDRRRSLAPRIRVASPGLLVGLRVIEVFDDARIVHVKLPHGVRAVPPQPAQAFVRRDPRDALEKFRSDESGVSALSLVDGKNGDVARRGRGETLQGVAHDRGMV